MAGNSPRNGTADCPGLAPGPSSACCRLAAEALADYQRLDRPGWAADRLQRGWAVFCQLRTLLRLSDEELPGGPRPPSSAPLGPTAAAARLRAIAADLQRYHQDLRQRVRTPAADGPGSFQPDSIVLRYLDRYGDGLTGHPVVRDQAGRAVAVVDRTNNVIEQSFAIAKRACAARVVSLPTWGATWRTSRRKPPWLRICSIPTTTGPVRARSTNCGLYCRRTVDAELRRRNRAWADDARHCPKPNYPQARLRTTGIQLNSDAVACQSTV